MILSTLSRREKGKTKREKKKRKSRKEGGKEGEGVKKT